MLSKFEYTVFKEKLEQLGLDVHHEEGFYDFINYRDKENNRTVYTISKEERGYDVNTFFGGIILDTIVDVLEILEEDWNKENWIEQEINGVAFIALKRAKGGSLWE